MERFTKVAALLAKGSPPDWLAPALADFAKFIGPKKDGDDTLERNMFEAARYLDRWLPMYAYLEEWGFEVPTCIGEAQNALNEALPFLAQQINLRGGGRPVDGDKAICASVCVEAYRILHGDVHPHSADQRQACEDYWIACGKPPTSNTPGVLAGDNWRRHLEKVRDGDGWIKGRLELYRNPT